MSAKSAVLFFCVSASCLADFIRLLLYINLTNYREVYFVNLCSWLEWNENLANLCLRRQYTLKLSGREVCSLFDGCS